MAGFRDYLRMAMGWWSTRPAAPNTAFHASVEFACIRYRLVEADRLREVVAERLRLLEADRERELWTEDYVGQINTERSP